MIRKAVLAALVIFAVAIALFIFFKNGILCCAGPIVVFEPVPNAIISSPVLIKGQARGSWFFEASFPVKLLDGNGKPISSGIAQAEGEWMTNDFVSFRAELSYNGFSSTTSGVLVLKKDNPSGMRELDDELILPVRFR